MKGDVPPTEVLTRNGIRLRSVARVGGKVLFVYAVYADTASFINAEKKDAELARITGGWVGAWAFGKVGAAAGCSIAAAGGQLGPQVATPEEGVTVPIGGLVGGVVGGIGGYWLGSHAGLNYYKFLQEY